MSGSNRKWMQYGLYLLIATTVFVFAFSSLPSPYKLSCGPESSAQTRLIAQKAAEQNDPDICSKITKGGILGCGPGGMVESQHIHYCYVEVAAITGNVDLCNTHYGDRCVAEVAERKKDASICESAIPEPSNRYFCYYDVAIVTKDVSLCGKLKNGSMLREQCYRLLQ